MKLVRNTALCAAAVMMLVATAPAQAEPDPLARLSDEFDRAATLKDWQRVYAVEKSNANQLARFDIDKTRDGWMTLVPHASVWYRDYRGVLVFKEVKGDFIVTTRLRVSNRADKGAPGSQFSLAGIMVRTPRDVTPRTWQPGHENYVFLSVGAADRPGRYQNEVKTTVNSDSQLEITDAPGEEMLLRAARVGEYLILLRKPVDGQWAVHRRYRRADMPDTLQVGLTCYTDWQTCSRMQPREHNVTVIKGGNPDLVAHADFMRYRTPNVPDALRDRDLADPRAVSDGQLLAFLGAAADGAVEE